MTSLSAAAKPSNAVWLYLGREARTPEEVEQLLDWCGRNRIGKVLVHMDLQPAHQDAIRDQLNRLTDACASAGIEVHGMISALIQRTKNRVELQFQDPDCYCVDVHGISNWDEPVSGTAYVLDPGKPQVVETISRGVGRLLETFPGLAGVHLDFVRYYYFDSVLTVDTKSAGHWLGSVPKPGQPIRIETLNGTRTTFFVEEASNAYNDPPIGDKLTLRHEYRFCFCDACVSGFLAQSGVQLPPALALTPSAAGAAAPDAASADADADSARILRGERAQWLLREHAAAWAAYRAGLITALIAAIRRAGQDVRPTTQLSATIWYNAPYGNELRGLPLQPDSVYDGFGQKWQDWVAQGLVDFLCPMDYWLAPDSFEAVVKQQTAAAGEVPVYPGILNSAEYALNAEQFQTYKTAAELSGAAGITFFHYGSWKEVL
ncbi:hypothetical protein [Paenibacillus sp. HJGM_3]|uniref:hypothetical protein n=1 Tax=Paenibacillus sp. HJGM_3 TaxID=3379816 RepID=UPI00385B0617